MELIIVFIVLFFLIGTVGIALPSKSSKKISSLRMEASRTGFKITSSSFGNLSFKNKDLSLVNYQIKNTTNLKEAHFIRDKDDLILYSPLKLKYSKEYDEINNKLKEVSNFVHEVIFSNASIAFLWEEKAGIEELNKIRESLEFF
tara:strand:+ start:4819 stop:5253 length:435 start_codon:yes stop_codon:yes gene_type:complete